MSRALILRKEPSRPTHTPVSGFLPMRNGPEGQSVMYSADFRAVVTATFETLHPHGPERAQRRVYREVIPRQGVVNGPGRFQFRQ